MDVNEILKEIKNELEDRIINPNNYKDSKNNIFSNGLKAKESYIKSSKLINLIHKLIKNELIENGININKIYPPFESTKPEIKLKGFLKNKNQDIVVINSLDLLIDIKKSSIINSEKILSINIRSQLSSLAKNIDTLFERTFAESLNLHLQNQKQCLGEVYLIPTHEYDSSEMKNNIIGFKKVTNLEDYIRKFQSINNRVLNNDEGQEYKYERVCLMIVDFRLNQPKIYNSFEQLKEDNLIAENIHFNFKLEELTFDKFIIDLLKIYDARFGIEDLLK